MTDLLQTYQPALFINAAPRAQVSLPTRSAYKNELKIYNHQTRPSELSIPNNMEHEARNQIERILDQVHSLDDLSADDITELRYISECPLVIDKFKISPAQYWDWVEKVGNDIKGIEYDAQNECLILKEDLGWMHENLSDMVRDVFLQLSHRLNTATGSLFFSTGSTDYELDGKFVGSVKQADASLRKFKAHWPVVVLEIGISETTRKLCNDAERWLEGSDGHTKLVIIIDVQETQKRRTSNDKWELSENDFREMSQKRLVQHILQWYESKGIRLLGSFKLSMHLWYSDGDRQCILNKAVFSPDNLIDLTAIEDVPLRLEYLIPDGNPLDEDQPFTFPLRSLVERLQFGFEEVQIERAKKLARNMKKKYR